jgi:hypothetical protein
MPDLSQYDAKHWRERADEARAMASYLTNPVARDHMLNCVAGYERLARMAEERRIFQDPPKVTDPA